jgi:hypothetical protein
MAVVGTPVSVLNSDEGAGAAIVIAGVDLLEARLIKVAAVETAGTVGGQAVATDVEDRVLTDLAGLWNESEVAWDLVSLDAAARLIGNFGGGADGATDVALLGLYFDTFSMVLNMRAEHLDGLPTSGKVGPLGRLETQGEFWTSIWPASFGGVTYALVAIILLACGPVDAGAEIATGLNGIALVVVLLLILEFELLITILLLLLDLELVVVIMSGIVVITIITVVMLSLRRDITSRQIGQILWAVAFGDNSDRDLGGDVWLDNDVLGAALVTVLVWEAGNERALSCRGSLGHGLDDVWGVVFVVNGIISIVGNNSTLSGVVTAVTIVIMTIIMVATIAVTVNEAAAATAWIIIVTALVVVTAVTIIAIAEEVVPMVINAITEVVVATVVMAMVVVAAVVIAAVVIAAVVIAAVVIAAVVGEAEAEDNGFLLDSVGLETITNDQAIVVISGLELGSLRLWGGRDSVRRHSG